ncbi:hypothetical protein OAK04_02870 [Verrucomicrobia bacterium]|nr:hypothetical protein [Verrucomicrobiota bacterium]
MKMILPLLLPLVLFFGGCKKKEPVDGAKSTEATTAPESKLEEAKVNTSTDSLADNIVGKVISLESEAYVGQIQQLQFNGDGRMMGGENGSIVDIGLTYKIEGNEVLVFKEEERDGGISFSSSSPKVGDQVEWGAEKEEIRGKITKIESSDKILNDPVRQKRAAAKAAARAGQNRNANWISGLYSILYSLYGKDDKLPEGPLEKKVLRELGSDAYRYTRMKNPETGETRQVLYNLLPAFDNPKHIILASPWVYGNQRWVIYGDGSGKMIDEERYQQEIQKDEVEMRPFK